MKFPLIIIFGCLFLSACASRAARIGGPAEAEPGQVSFVKTPAKVTEAGSIESKTEGGVFFANVRILTETKSDNCSVSVSKREKKHQDWIAPSKGLGATAIFNVQLKSNGFDEASYQFTEIDRPIEGNVSAGQQNPYGLKIRWRGAAKIEVQFLDQVERIQLDATPILSFQATEKRDGCKIDHQVNLFADGWKKVQP